MSVAYELEEEEALQVPEERVDVTLGEEPIFEVQLEKKKKTYTKIRKL